ncbi:MAG: hypothetical protein ABIT37_18565 [Luteolibacter sp.]
MNIDLTAQDIETLINSLEYSKRRVSDAQGTPNEVRQETLAQIETVTAKIREARRRA